MQQPARREVLEQAPPRLFRGIEAAEPAELRGRLLRAPLGWSAAAGPPLLEAAGCLEAQSPDGMVALTVQFQLRDLNCCLTARVFKLRLKKALERSEKLLVRPKCVLARKSYRPTGVKAIGARRHGRAPPNRERRVTALARGRASEKMVGRQSYGRFSKGPSHSNGGIVRLRRFDVSVMNAARRAGELAPPSALANPKSPPTQKGQTAFDLPLRRRKGRSSNLRRQRTVPRSVRRAAAGDQWGSPPCRGRELYL